MMNKEIALNHINSVVAPHLTSLGFKSNKAGSYWHLKSTPWTVELNIHLTARNSGGNPGYT